MPALSVLICTHKPHRDYLRRVLDSLDAQTLDKEHWELLLIDNANEVELSAHWPLSWHPHARHVRETTLGLTPSRIRGVRESRGDLLVYVDDDNVLAADYLTTARALMDKYPYLGVIGAGTLEPEYAVRPASHVAPYLDSLSLRKVTQSHWSNNLNDRASVPWGAGLCVRRHVAAMCLTLIERLSVNVVLDRRGEHLFGNGDVAFSWSSTMLGQGFGVFPQLHVTHLIRAERLAERHLLRLARDRAFSGGVFDFLRTGIVPGDQGGRVERYLRASLRGIRRGPLAVRMDWAVARGSDLARAFIEQQRLQPFAEGRI